jgi:23S rRNA (uracil1939-C5)-methyltransferase
VSCDPPTLARDARHLADAGYEMGRLQAFDLFPNTAHVECVTVLDLRAVRLGRTVTSGATR